MGGGQWERPPEMGRGAAPPPPRGRPGVVVPVAAAVGAGPGRAHYRSQAPLRHCRGLKRAGRAAWSGRGRAGAGQVRGARSTAGVGRLLLGRALALVRGAAGPGLSVPRVAGAAMGADRQAFEGFFPQVVRDLTADGLRHPEVGDAVARLKEVLEYNSPGGKHTRGLTVLAAFRRLVRPEQQGPDSVQCALVVGWCIELLQAFFLVADDIMDSSLTRRGRPCWYKKEGIGLDAVNDSFLLESSIYRLLKKYCRGQPYYLHLLELFLQTSYQTELGQALDLITAPPTQVDLARFTEQRYKAIVKYKTAFYSFYLPVAAAMYMAGIESEEEHANAKAILLEMGEFFQIQDDFLDCFGDPSLTGKIGTDIQDNKCSWLVVECLRRASPEQRQLLEENYGQKELEKVARVKELYETLGLRAVYQEYEERSFQRLQQLIEAHTHCLPKEIFLDLAHIIYKRQK